MKLPHYRESTIPKEAKKVFEGVLFDVYQWEQKLFDGSTATFEKLARADTAIVFPILADGRILLIRDEQPTKTSEYTAPAGRIEDGETPEQAAFRELEEETGYRPGSLVPFYSHAPASKIDWHIYVFIGKNCTKIREPYPEPGERITPTPVTFDELVDLITREEKPHHYGHLTRLVYEGLGNPAKMEELRKLFSN